MGFTRREFLRLLPSLGLTAEEEGRYRAALGRGEVLLELGEEGRRRLGSFTLPELPILLEFRDCGEAEMKEFLGRFDRLYQRGGG